MSNNTPANKSVKAEIVRALPISGLPTPGAIAEAFGTAARTEVARVRVVLAYRAQAPDLKGNRMSPDAIVADAIKRNKGKAVDGFSRSAVARYVKVADVLLTTPASALPVALTDDKGNATEHGAAIVKSLVSVANYDGNVADALKAVSSAKTPAGAVAAAGRKVQAAAVAQKARKASRAGQPNKVTGAEKTPAEVTDTTPAAPATPVGIVALAEALTALLGQAKSITTEEADALADLAVLADDIVAAHHGVNA